jgi:predicted MFS family arabinose efflux permease
MSAVHRKFSHNPAGRREERVRARKNHANSSVILSICNFLSKGWEVSILGLLAFLQQKYAMPLYMVGIFSAVFIVSQIGISFFAGKIAHAIHSRNVILLSIAASSLSWLTLFFSSRISLLFLAYMFGGISSGLFEPIGNSLVAKLSSSKNRGTAIGNFAAFGDMGRIAIVAAATALAGFFGVNNACAVLFASAVIALIFAAAFIPKANGAADSEAQEIPVHLGDLLKNSKFCFATTAGIADSFSSASLYIFIPFLLTAKGITLANTLYFNVIFFAGYMSGRLALGRLADRHGAPHTLMWSKVAMAALILLLTLATGRAMMVILLFLLGVFTRGSSPIIRAMVADSMDERISFHNAFSAYSFASRSSSALCRPIYGFLASWAGIASVFYVAAAVSLLTLYPAAKYKNQ